MTHDEKIQWMALWACKNKVTLDLEGECGFERKCVGIIAQVAFVDYDEEDENIFVPQDAYHKHPCVAVLGHGEEAESQLYDWLKWFEDNNYIVERGVKDNIGDMHTMQLLMGQHYFQRMVKVE